MKQIELSIRTFVEEIYKGDDLVFSPMSPKRAQEGMYYHQMLQHRREAEAYSEYPLHYLYAQEDLLLSLNGRIDGLCREGALWCVEEVKTSYRSASSLGEGEEVHWAQAKAYAAIYALDNGLDEISVRLLYILLPQEEEYVLERVFSSRELLLWLDGLCEAYLKKAAQRYARLREVSCSIAALPFPYAAPRSGQQLMMDAVQEQIALGGHLYVEAPTGIGKTMGTLFPALKALAQENCEKIFYLTARSTVRSVAAESFERLCETGLRARAVILWAKETLCPQPGMPGCHPDWCPLASGFFTRLPEALASLPRWGVITRELLLATAQKYRLCPHELALAVAEESEVVICDYNHVFDPAARILRFFLRGGPYTLLIDEAHNLADRARDMFSAALGEEELRAFRALLPKEEVASPEEKYLYQALNALLKALRALRKELKADALTETVLSELPAECEDAALALQEQLFKTMLGEGRRLYGKPLLDLFYRCRSFNIAHRDIDETSALCAYVQENALRLEVQNIDPSPRLMMTLAKVQAAVFFSATLQPFSYYDRLYGSGGGGAYLSLESPFPQKNCLYTHIPADVVYDMRTQSLESVVRALKTLVQGKTGNYLVFFPSYIYMQAVHEAFTRACPEVFAPCQAADADPAHREAFLALFETNDRPMMAFAVLGGIYSEGIDLVGEKLIGVAVIGVGLPGISLRQELIRKYYDDRFEDGYAFAYKIPGMNKVRQAAGRLIRTEEDSGVILLLDKRYAREDYMPLLPELWVRGMKSAHTPGELHRLLKAFWGTAD